MPISDQHPTKPASDDQLAALYLRDRDTPCPNCTYNRRDSTTSLCPECGTELILVGTNSMLVPKYDSLARAGLLIGSLMAFFEVAERSYTTIFPFIQLTLGGGIGYLVNGYPTNLFYLIAVFAYFFWIALFVIVFRRWLIARRGKTIQMKKIIRPMAAMLLLYVCETVFFTLAGIFIF